MSMRVLRFLRPERSTPTSLKASAPADDLGLDAFATEESRPAPGAGDGPFKLDRLRIALIAVAALAVIEAIPTLLWLRGSSGPEPVATVAAAAPAPAPIPASAASTTPPCTPTPAAQPTATAGTTRPDESTRAAAPRTAPPGLVAGLVAITAPVPMHVYAGGRLVGTTEADTIMLPVGEHEVELVSDAVGMRTRRTITVQAGRTTALKIDSPRVAVNVNAIPWAEVWVDNQRIGETPIGNLQQTIGSHEFVFRHPELGERRMVVMITMKEPVRISMDLRKR
jgi:hypothetical protein